MISHDNKLVLPWKNIPTTGGESFFIREIFSNNFDTSASVRDRIAWIDKSYYLLQSYSYNVFPWRCPNHSAKTFEEADDIINKLLIDQGFVLLTERQMLML